MLKLAARLMLVVGVACVAGNKAQGMHGHAWQRHHFTNETTHYTPVRNSYGPEIKDGPGSWAGIAAFHDREAARYPAGSQERWRHEQLSSFARFQPNGYEGKLNEFNSWGRAEPRKPRSLAELEAEEKKGRENLGAAETDQKKFDHANALLGLTLAAEKPQRANEELEGYLRWNMANNGSQAAARSAAAAKRYAPTLHVDLATDQAEHQEAVSGFKATQPTEHEKAAMGLRSEISDLRKSMHETGSKQTWREVGKKEAALKTLEKTIEAERKEQGYQAILAHFKTHPEFKPATHDADVKKTEDLESEIAQLAKDAKKPTSRLKGLAAKIKLALKKRALKKHKKKIVENARKAAQEAIDEAGGHNGVQAHLQAAHTNLAGLQQEKELLKAEQASSLQRQLLGEAITKTNKPDATIADHAAVHSVAQAAIDALSHQAILQHNAGLHEQALATEKLINDAHEIKQIALQRSEDIVHSKLVVLDQAREIANKMGEKSPALHAMVGADAQAAIEALKSHAELQRNAGLHSQADKTEAFKGIVQGIKQVASNKEQLARSAADLDSSIQALDEAEDEVGKHAEGSEAQIQAHKAAHTATQAAIKAAEDHADFQAANGLDAAADGTRQLAEALREAAQEHAELAGIKAAPEEAAD